MHFIKRHEVRPHVIFLSDYDMLMTEHLVQGVDVWINTPRRPWEACGTSGMKVLVNGGLNLSELDGWWAEAYSPEVGWALGDGKEHTDAQASDAAEAYQLYDLLEKQIVPEFYARDQDGLPTKWIARIRESMARLTPRFSADRAVREYTEQYYLPAAANYRKRAENQGSFGEQFLVWKHALDLHWQAVRFSEVKIETVGDQHQYEVQVYLDGLDPSSVQVQLYAEGVEAVEGVEEGRPFVQVLTYDRGLISTPGSYVYRGAVSSKRDKKDYTPRILPFYPGAQTPLEATHILWYQS